MKAPAKADRNMLDFWHKEIALNGDHVRLNSPLQKDYSSWAQLRWQSRNHLEPWEPKWGDDALTRHDWQRKLAAWRRMARERRGYYFLIWTRDEAELAGGVSLSNIRTSPERRGTLGYWLGERFVGRGLMSDAVNTICEWGFRALDLDSVDAGTVPENHRSQKVLTRCGFARNGYAMDYLQIAGRRRDHVLFLRPNPRQAESLP